MTLGSAFDPALPTLPVTLNSAMVAQLLEADWAAARPADLSALKVLHCQQQTSHYQPAERCVTTYSLTVAAADAAPWPLLVSVAATPTGIKHQLYFDDPQLPGLLCATDQRQMGEHFRHWLTDAGQACTVIACTITPIRYKPGSRCTLRYAVQTDRGQQVYFGKVLAQGGEQLLAVVNALYQASLLMPAWPRIPRPLAYWPAAQLVVQSAIADGAELHKLLFDQQIEPSVRHSWLYLAGKSLAALHNFTGLAGPQRTLLDDGRDLLEYYGALVSIEAGLATQFAQNVDELVTRAQLHAEGSPVASHGALRTDQFLLDQGHPVLIDLDTFCWANPARDVGNLLAYLAWKALRQPQHAAFIQQAEQTFLAGYQALRPSPEPHWLALYQAASLLKIGGRRFQSLACSEWPLIPQLLNAVRSLLAV